MKYIKQTLVKKTWQSVIIRNQNKQKYFPYFLHSSFHFSQIYAAQIVITNMKYIKIINVGRKQGENVKMNSFGQ